MSSNPIRILIVTQSFPPEMGALPSRMYPFANELTRAGHTVFVATCMPNYPKGRIFDGYRRKLTNREQVDGYTVLRTWTYCVPRNITKLRQLMSYLCFVPAVFWSGARAGKVDVVFVTSPPIFPAISAILLAKWRRAKLVFDIRDMWPDELVACGAARSKSLPIRFMSVLERFIYRKADAICCTTRAFMDAVAERGGSRNKILFLPNGADTELFQPCKFDVRDRRPEPLKNKFVVLYSGILGIKQGLPTLLAAAKLLEGEADIVFHLVGGGSREEEVREHARRLQLTNVIFAGHRNLQEVPGLIQSADVCVSLLMPEPYLQKIISVKIYEYLACGKPVIGAHEGESARVIRESGAGLVVPSGDSEALAQAIRRLRDDVALRAGLGACGREWVERYRSRSKIAQRLERILTAIVNPTKTISILSEESATDADAVRQDRAKQVGHVA